MRGDRDRHLTMEKAVDKNNQVDAAKKAAIAAKKRQIALAQV